MAKTNGQDKHKTGKEQSSDRWKNKRLIVLSQEDIREHSVDFKFSENDKPFVAFSDQWDIQLLSLMISS